MRNTDMGYDCVVIVSGVCVCCVNVNLFKSPAKLIMSGAALRSSEIVMKRGLANNRL